MIDSLNESLRTSNTCNAPTVARCDDTWRSGASENAASAVQNLLFASVFYSHLMLAVRLTSGCWWDAHRV